MKIALIVLGMLLAGVVCVQVYQLSQKNKTAYLELGKVYNEFQMKKELESKLGSVTQARKAVLDSLRTGLEIMSKQLEGADEIKNRQEINLFRYKQEEYVNKKRQLEEDDQNTLQQYNEQVMKQLNQYVKDYGKQHDLSYLFGAEGSGALMYAREEDNITEDVITYINKRYKGSNGSGK